MPRYVFNCKTCGSFEVQMSMKDATSSMACPSCTESSPRSYAGTHIMQMDSRLRKRIEEGSQPRIVRKEHLPPKPVHHHHARSRPWQFGHSHS